VPVPVPSPGPREILIKVRAAGYCHTDSLMPLSPTIGGPLPITGSHEPAGVVVGMGDKVEQQGKFRVGDRVMAVNTARACGECFLFRFLGWGKMKEEEGGGVLGRSAFDSRFSARADPESSGQCSLCKFHDERSVLKSTAFQSCARLESPASFSPRDQNHLFHNLCRPEPPFAVLIPSCIPSFTCRSISQSFIHLG